MAVEMNIEERDTFADMWKDAEVISVYTRAQAIEDGVLVDMTEWASADKGFIGGFKCPVAVTAAVWADINAIPKSKGWQDVRGRAHDVLAMAALAARKARDSSAVLYKVIIDIAGDRKRYHTYKLVAGPGDNGELVITIMQPRED